MLLIAQIGLEIAAKGAALRALHIPLADAVCHPCFQVEAFAVGVEIVVQTVVQLVFVHAQSSSPGPRPSTSASLPGSTRAIFIATASTSFQTEQEGEGMRPPFCT